MPRLYPSPRGRYLAVIGASGPLDQITIVDLVDHRLLPFYPPRLGKALVFGRFGGWHPDGRHILYIGSDNRTGLWLVDVENEQSPQYLSEHTPDSTAFSPDGQELVFAERPLLSDKSELWLAWADGSHERKISEVPRQSAISDLSWSPDGKAVAYNVGGAQIWLLPLEGKPRLLTHDYMGGYGYRWSPDGQFIVFVAQEIPQGKSTEHLMPNTEKAYLWAFSGLSLHVVDVRTGEEWRLIQDGRRGDVQPYWSPDGSKIAFTSLRSGHLAVWMIHIDGSDLQQITPVDTTLYSGPVWLSWGGGR